MLVLSQSRKQKLINQFQKFLQDEQILFDEVDLDLYDSDATSLFKHKAEMIVMPENLEQVQKIIKTINKENQSLNDGEVKWNFVARGAGTGLAGGAIAAEASVIISLARLNNILEIDVDNRTALVETGVVNLSLSEMIKDTGLHFAPDPSSEKSCTIGGNVAENAGGIHCYKYGVTTDHVLALEVVLPNGDITWLGSNRIKADGPDLAKLFVGSEGMFGIATKALLRLTPLPESFLTMQVSFANVRKAAELVADIIKQGFKPAALEMMDTLTIKAVDEAFKLGFTKPDGTMDINAVLLIELDGDEDEIQLEAKKIKKLIDSYQPLKFEETQDIKERDRLWKVRKGAVAAFGQLAPCWYLYDSVVPRSEIPEALDRIAEIAKRYDLPLANVFHAADGNLHPNLLYDPDADPTVIDRIHKASKEIMQVAIDLGGVLSGEHGIGLEKKDYMQYMFTDYEMNLMMQVRKVFDPELVSNPDKMFPTKICYEASHNQVLNKKLL